MRRVLGTLALQRGAAGAAAIRRANPAVHLSREQVIQPALQHTTATFPGRPVHSSCILATFKRIQDLVTGVLRCGCRSQVMCTPQLKNWLGGDSSWRDEYFGNELLVRY